MKYIASCSFGKDSLASILLALKHNEPLDRVVFVEVMFDKTNNISGEDPRHINWIYEKAIPILERKGLIIDVIRSEKDYLSEFHSVLGQKAKFERIGKIRGFLIGGKCRMNSEGKIKPIKKYLKSFNDEILIYVGIAADEPERLKRLDKNKISLLNKYGYTEAQAYELCKKNNLLSPIYENGTRNGCWFCPNSKIKYCSFISNQYPELWGLLRQLDKEPNKVTNHFKYLQTFSEIEQKIKIYNESQKQMKIEFY